MKVSELIEKLQALEHQDAPISVRIYSEKSPYKQSTFYTEIKKISLETIVFMPEKPIRKHMYVIDCKTDW